MNARETVRLEKQHRNIDAFKNSLAKEHTAEKNRVKSRLQDLRKTVLCRTHSLDTAVNSTEGDRVDASNGVHLPKLPTKPEENCRKMTRERDLTRSLPDIHMIYTENEQKSTQLPVVTLNSPRGKRRLKNRGYNVRDVFTNSPRMRTQSHGDLRADECGMVEDINCNLKNKSDQEIDQRLEGIANRREFLDPSCIQGRNSLTALRRRSLSTGDITLTEKIHSFLEGVENYRVSSNSLDYSSSNSEEEADVF